MGLTLQEAVKSGKPFRRKSWKNPEENVWIVKHFKRYKWSGENLEYKALVCDAISDDWEIQEKTSYNKADVERAINSTINFYAHFTKLLTEENVDEIMKRAMKAAESSSDDREEV